MEERIKQLEDEAIQYEAKARACRKEREQLKVKLEQQKRDQNGDHNK